MPAPISIGRSKSRAQQRDCEAIATQREEIVTAGQPVGTADPEYVTDEVRDGRDLH
jgi:hypothetical protein